MRSNTASLKREASAALVAVVVAASLLVSSAAHATVTKTAAERFGGRDRYETSVAVAEAYLAEIADNLDRAPMSAVIVVSGEDRHAAYAMPAPGLASAFDAPILMTPTTELHSAAAAFLDGRDFELALVLGGTEVVSAEVVEDLLNRVSSVRRISGPDAYVTAVAVAAEVGPIPGSAGEWGSRGRTALLANGETVADALVAGPLAYHGEHPLLLTPAASLDRRVSDYLDRSDVEHVVVLGGTAAVGPGVVSAVQSKGIVVSRLAGEDRYGTSAVLARGLLGSGRPDPCFDGSVIGLAVGERAPDAVSSGPLLGERCAPLLLVRPRAVPAVTDDVLTGDLLGGSDGRLDVAVFGGTGAVADSTVTAVRNNAQRGEPFTAEVSATAGSKIFTVTFNEDVKETDDAGNPVATDPDRYTVNNAALVLEGKATTVENPRRYTEITLSGRTVTVELVEPLVVGNTITVVGETGTPEGRTQIAVDDTLPALESVFYRVPRAPAVTDTTGPQIQIVAVAGESTFVVLVTERALRRGDRLRNDVIYRGEPVQEVTVVDADGEPKDVTFVHNERDCPHKSEDGDPALDLNSPLIGEQCYEDPATLGANLRYTADVSRDSESGVVLGPGDVITVHKRALYDQDRNPSRLTRYTVTEHADNGANGDFTVKRAAVGTPRHAKQASLLIQNGNHEANRRLRIDARTTGVAAGAAGNSWVVYPYVDPDRSEPADSVIDVGVDPVHRIISYTIVEGKITLANLTAALNADTTFRRHFSARVVTSSPAAAVLDIAEASGVPLSGGISSVGVRVTFTDHVRSISTDSDVADADRFAQFFGPTPPTPRGFKSRHLLASLFLDGRSADNEQLAVRCQRRGPVVYLAYATTDDALLPRAGTPVHFPAGMATGFGDTDGNDTLDVQNLAKRRFNLRHDAAIPDQFGYEVEQLTSDAPGQNCDGRI